MKVKEIVCAVKIGLAPAVCVSVCVCARVCVCVCACDGCTVMSDGGRNIGITDVRWLAADSMGKQQHKQITTVTCV